MSKKKVALWIVILTVLLLIGCIKKSKESVFTEGSSSMEKVIGMLGESFQNDTNISFTYNPTGSSSGINGVLEGRCDIGLSSRRLTEAEKENDLKETILAYDGIVIIVNKENPISDLSMDDIGKIYKGEIANWSELGGKDEKIVLIGREAGSGTREGFEGELNIKGLCKYRQELTSTGDIITAILNNPGAIGYASLASVKDSVKMMTVDGVKASEMTIRDGSYALQRPFILVTNSKESFSSSAEKFMEYIMSEEARELILKAGVVPAND